MVESARQKGEELAAVYEEKLQAEAEEIQSHMDAELQKANTRYQKIYAEMETMTSVLEKNRRIFEETFAGIEKMREEMKRSASEVETFMKDPVKVSFPERQKKQPQSQAVKIPQKKQRKKTKSSKIPQSSISKMSRIISMMTTTKKRMKSRIARMMKKMRKSNRKQ